MLYVLWRRGVPNALPCLPSGRAWRSQQVATMDNSCRHVRPAGEPDECPDEGPGLTRALLARDAGWRS